MNRETLSFDPTQFRIRHEQTTVQEDLVGLKAAAKILQSWKLSNSEIVVVLGDIPISEFDRIVGGDLVDKLTIDQRTRISLVLGIYKVLNTLFIQDLHKLEWINNPNSAFKNFSPKEIMLSGALIGLYDIRRYLETRLV